MYHQDRNLQISSSSGSYLAIANYKLLIEGYEKLLSIAFGKCNKSLNIDLSHKVKMSESLSIESKGLYLTSILKFSF